MIPKRADYIFYYKPNIPIAIIEAKDNCHSVGDGMQQALDYATTLNIPFVFSSNGDGFVFHDRTGGSIEKEALISLDSFPSPKELWSKRVLTGTDAVKEVGTLLGGELQRFVEHALHSLPAFWSHASHARLVTSRS